MKLIELTPIRDMPGDVLDKLEQAICKLLKAEIYLPLIEELNAPKKTLQNSLDDLLQGLLSGLIVFSHGKFQGSFSAATSKALRKLGATWDRPSKSYKIHYSRLPISVRQTISVSEARFTQKMQKIDRKLAHFLPEEIAGKLNVTDLINKSIFKIEDEFKKSVRNITVVPILTEDQRTKIAAEYADNLKLKIKYWTETEISKLRVSVQKSFYKGYRYESIVKTIQQSYGVSLTKAKFLARQETNLLLTKYKEARYTSSGVNEYKWRCVIGSPLHPVRPMHQALNDRSNKGELFRFDDPPKDDPSGAKHNPGENYNCRCIAIPVVKFKK